MTNSNSSNGRPSYSDNDILAAIGDDRLTTNEIAAVLDCYRGTANRRLQELEEDGLVVSTPAGKTHLWERSTDRHLAVINIPPFRVEDFINLSWDSLRQPQEFHLESQRPSGVENIATEYVWALPDTDFNREIFETLRFGDILLFYYSNPDYSSSFFNHRYTDLEENQIDSDRIIGSGRVGKTIDDAEISDFLWPTTIGAELKTIKDLLKIDGLPSFQFPEPYLSNDGDDNISFRTVELNIELTHYGINPTVSDENTIILNESENIDTRHESIEAIIYLALSLQGSNLTPGQHAIKVPQDQNTIQYLLNEFVQDYTKDYPLIIELHDFERHAFPASKLFSAPNVSDLFETQFEDFEEKIAPVQDLWEHWRSNPEHDLFEIPMSWKSITKIQTWLNQIDNNSITLPPEIDRVIPDLYTKLDEETDIGPLECKSTNSSGNRHKDDALKSAFKEIIGYEYEYKCAICGRSRFSPTDVPEVTATMITSPLCVTEDPTIDLRNGIALCSFHNWLFESGWITISPNQLHVRDLKETDVYSEIKRSAGEEINLPQNEDIYPHRKFISSRNEQLNEDWYPSIPSPPDY